MEQLKKEVYQVADTNDGMLQSLGSTLKSLEDLKNSFKQLR